jgi:hypothetical protein
VATEILSIGNDSLNSRLPKTRIIVCRQVVFDPARKQRPKTIHNRVCHDDASNRSVNSRHVTE